MKANLILIALFLTVATVTSCKENNVNIGNEEENPFVGEWKFILKYDLKSEKLSEVDGNTILKIWQLDSFLMDDIECMLSYEVYTNNEFHKGETPIYIYDKTTQDTTVKGGYFYLPFCEMRTCKIRFETHTGALSKDTISFTGNEYKVYYARIK